MGAVHDKLSGMKVRGEKALIAFITAGDPSLDDLPAILEALIEGGADVVEIGVPFSDPIADGPTIQASSQRALDRGVNPAMVLDAVRAARSSVPIVLMGYYNTILRHGLLQTAQMYSDAGASGSIVCDLIAEEGEEWLAASQDAGLDTIFLAAPTSTDARLDQVCGHTTGFVYAVSRTGVTGAGQSVPPDVSDLVRRIQARTNLPVCVGFGISTPEHVRMVCEVADGAVVGSFLVDLLAKEWNGGAGRSKVVAAVRSLKDATR